MQTTFLRNIISIGVSSAVAFFLVALIPAFSVSSVAYSGSQAFAYDPVPTCSFSANPSSVGYNGSSTLSWTTANATSASIDQGIGAVMTSGGYSLSNLTYSRTYTMTVTGPGGTNTCQTTVSVGQGSSVVPTCTLSASPSYVTSGNTTTLVWNSYNATNATLTDVGSVALNGSYTVGQQYGSRTYTLTVTNNGATNTCSTTVAVQNQNSYTAPTCTLDSTTSTTQGGQASLYWTTSNASSVSISGIGSVGTSGSYTVYPTTATTYVLTATGNGGSVSCTRTVTVSTTYPNYYDTPTCSLTVTPAVVYNNGFATLNWTTTNGTYVSIDNGIGQVATSGSYALGQIYGTRSYTLTVTGPNGTRNCTANVSAQNAIANTNTTNTGSVLGASTGGPTCGIVVRPTHITGGQMATLAWYAQNATSVVVSGIGSVANSGTYAIAPTQTTTYTMTVRGYSGEVRTCDATILVSNTGAYYPQNYGNGGMVLGASTEDILPLRQVPYTGAEDYIYPLFVVALGITAFYGASKMGKQVYA